MHQKSPKREQPYTYEGQDWQAHRAAVPEKTAESDKEAERLQGPAGGDSATPNRLPQPWPYQIPCGKRTSFRGSHEPVKATLIYLHIFGSDLQATGAEGELFPRQAIQKFHATKPCCFLHPPTNRDTLDRAQVFSEAGNINSRQRKVLVGGRERSEPRLPRPLPPSPSVIFKVPIMSRRRLVGIKLFGPGATERVTSDGSAMANCAPASTGTDAGDRPTDRSFRVERYDQEDGAPSMPQPPRGTAADG